MPRPEEGKIMERHLCTIAGCTHEAEEAGLCCSHYTSALVHGTLQYTMLGARPAQHRTAVAQS